MLICPRKFKRCWSPRKFANFANICFPPLELTFFEEFVVCFWRICRLFQYFLLHRFQFSCHTICIGCEPGLENFQFVKYWKIGELPKQSTAKIVNKTAKPSIIQKGYLYFTKRILTYYIVLLNIIFYWNWLKRGHFTIFLTGSEKDQMVILFSNIP